MEVEDPKEWRKRTAQEIMAQYPWLLDAMIDVYNLEPQQCTCGAKLTLGLTCNYPYSEHP